jgi:soluble lytic murein transglycosylase
MGLMQLRPDTAKDVAQKNKFPMKTLDLLEPHTNIQLGSGYLRMLLERYQFNPVLATAAYNAGPGRIRKWLPKKDLPADIWIESMPFQETRDYVKNVLTYTIVYRELLGQHAKLSHYMPQISGTPLQN